MNRFTLGLSLATLVVATGIAIAQPAPIQRPLPPGMAREVTRDEARAGAEKLFAAMDLNHDGKLDTADREVHMGRMFDRIDVNHDGSISRAEFFAAHKESMERREAPSDEGPARMMRMRAMEMGGQILREADPQHTGSVSHDAFVAAALALFDKADANHDGKVTPEERRAAMTSSMSGHMGMRRGAGAMGGMDMHGDDMMPGPGE